MEKSIWSENSTDYGHGYGYRYELNAIDANGLGAARGLLIGLAISQVFWLALAFFLF